MADSRHGADQKERQEQKHTQEKNSPARPFWLPADPDHPLLADAEGILADLYQELVVEAADAQRRTTGMTIVQLTWLELATAHELGVLSEDDFLNPTSNRELLDRYLQISTA